MFIAINKFKVAHGREHEFEEVWKNRESRLDEMPGFLKFEMLKGQPQEGHLYYLSKTDWESAEDFQGWVSSEQFKASHGKSKMPPGVIMGPPQFEGYEVIF